MIAKRLLAHYERIADAPDAIPRLRRFILNLAVRGKLVSRNAMDEQGPEPPNWASADNRPPNELPSSWHYPRLGDILADDTRNGYSRKPDDASGGTPILRISAGTVRRDGIVAEEEHKLISGIDEGTRRQFGLNPGDLLACRFNGNKAFVGRLKIFTNYLRIQPIYPDKLIRVRVSPVHVVPAFLRLAGDSDLVRNQIETACATTVGNWGISASNLKDIRFPLPPLAEQCRIVAKVDELMALCDRLEAIQAQREGRRDQLMTASLARLSTPDPDTFGDDARFALDALPALTTRPDQIREFRQTILNLAVLGKLVPQHPKDEPGSELLKQVMFGKLELKRTTNDFRIRMAPTPTPDKLPMVLPTGWAVQSFENLFLFIDYRGKTPPKTDKGIPLITAKNIRMGHLNREPQEFISERTFKAWMTRGFPRVGDLFFTTEAPLANICINDMDFQFAMAQRVICLQPYGQIDTKFFMYALMSDLMQSLIGAHATGLTAKGIKAARLKALPVPIPPQAEQRRIVAKIDELMTLCGRLEAKLTTGRDTRRRLLESLLNEALAETVA
jgi:type I restriction enzyme S subunit